MKKVRSKFQAFFEVEKRSEKRPHFFLKETLHSLGYEYPERRAPPIRQSRFYGTATNVQAYANQLRRNGYSYKDTDGNTYQSGVYSAVHKSDFVGNKWLLGFVGSNDTTGGACWSCYSHSSYYAEVPDKTIIDSNGNTIKKPAYEDFAKKWGDVDLENPTNPSLPKLVKPKDSNGEVFNDKPF